MYSECPPMFYDATTLKLSMIVEMSMKVHTAVLINTRAFGYACYSKKWFSF